LPAQRTRRPADAIGACDKPDEAEATGRGQISRRILALNGADSVGHSIAFERGCDAVAVVRLLVRESV